MAIRATEPRVVLITDPRYDDDTLASKVEAALSVAGRGEVIVQLRDKSRDADAVLALGSRLHVLCKERGALFVVNDRLDIALALQADGVHLGGASVSIRDARELLGASSFISVAAHSAPELQAIAEEGADAALLSPIFPSPGKGEPLGVEALTIDHEIAPALSVYALGGVVSANAGSCIRKGATGIAAIRAIFDAEDAAEEMRRLLVSVRE